MILGFRTNIINFYAKFLETISPNTLVTDSMALDDGADCCLPVKHYFTLTRPKDEQVFVKVGISAVDIEGARKNVELKYQTGILTEYVRRRKA